MSIPPIIVPEYQFSDADGHPYAGGTIDSFIPDTSTPKQTWKDPDQTALNTNPVVLDAAGRCILYGDGEYRLLLRDVNGNEVWDIQATTLVSAAMAPVVAAPTIADAQELLGINDLIEAEALARTNADTAEQNARIAADNAEALARQNADTALQNNINAERDARIAADAHLQSEIDALVPSGGGTTAPSFQSGIAMIPFTASPAGKLHVTFPTPFTAVATAMVCTCCDPNFISGGPPRPPFIVDNLTVTGADVYASGYEPTSGLTLDLKFYWIATGH